MIRPMTVFFALSLPAVAQEVNCFDPITQMEMNICSYQEWEAADADLNRVYAAAMAIVQARDAEYPIQGLSEEDRLRAAQRAWVTFRDANCDAAGYQFRGGSAEPLLINGCLRSMTEARIEELEGLVSGF
ncbi:MAG: lysozyme inhibitor LprI family protein [Paracoccaceae bacterium]